MGWISCGSDPLYLALISCLGGPVICPTGKSVALLPQPMSTPSIKNILLRRLLDTALLIPAIPPHQEGRIAIVTNVECGMRWTRMAHRTKALTSRTVKSCGPDAPTLAFNLVTMLRIAPGMVARKPGSPGRARNKPLKPLRREGRIDPVNLW
jgi:hypothetical protein